MSHPSMDILVAYAAGALEPGFGLVVGAHLETCETCRAQLRSLETASGEALSSLPAASVGADALERVLQRLDEVPQGQATAPTRPLLQQLPLKPRRWLAHNVWVSAVDTPHASDNRVYILSAGAGTEIVRHRHSGAEFCTVLAGAFRDENGRFAAGDFAAMYSTDEHCPVVDGDETCICLFATEGRLQPTDMLGRLIFAWAGV